MVSKGLLLISQGKLEPNEIFTIKPCNPTKLLGIVDDLKGVTKLSIEAKFSYVHLCGRTMFHDCACTLSQPWLWARDQGKSGCKGASLGEARESHQRLPGV